MTYRYSSYMSTDKGAHGEQIACNILQKRSFVIVDKNYHCTQGEIDIIATKGAEVHFIEVKTTYGPYNPAENFHKTKLKRFMKAVRVYCYLRTIPDNIIHIDLALVDMKNRIFRLVPDANNYFD